MADEQRLIYKVELDESGYIRATDSMTASTSKLTDAQERANQTLQTNQTALRGVSANVQQTKRDLDAYNGTNERYRQQLQKSYNDAVKQEQDLTALVGKNQLAYENATKAAQDFADTSAKAANVQQQAGGGKIAPVSVAPIAPVAPPVNLANLEGLPQAVAGTANEFTALAEAIQLAETRMSELDSTSEEFKTLAPIVAQGKEVLAAYNGALEATGTATQGTAEKTQRLRTEIFNSTDELTKLAAAGKQNTQEYQDLTAHVAKLTQEYREQRSIIKVLSSETRAIDFGKAAVQAAISGFQAFTSVQLLLGDQSEATQKKVVQLFAAMQLLASLEQLSTSLKRGSTIATELQTAATATYTAVVGAATGALKTFRIALLGTGIGAAIVAIGFLVKKYIDYKNAIADANKDHKTLLEINKEAVKSYSEQVAKLGILRNKLNDLNTPLADRIKYAREYNEAADESNRIDLKQIENIDLLNKAIDRQVAAIEKRALATAAENVTAKAAEKFFTAQADARSKAEQQIADEAKSGLRDFSEETNTALDQALVEMQNSVKKLTDKQKKDAIEQQRKARQELRIQSIVENDKDVISSKKEFDRVSNLATQFAVPPVKFKKEPNAPKEIENVFEQERDKLLANLAALRAKEADSIKAINDEFAAKLVTEENRIAQLLKDKKITPEQQKVLIDLAVQVNQAGLNKALQDFNKKVIDERQKLNDELRKLQEKANQDTLNLIQDEFEKRKALIDANEAKELADQRNATDERLRSLDLERLLIGEEEYQKARQIIIGTGEQEVNAIIARAAQQRQDLSADIFKKSLEAYQTAISDIGLIEDKRQADEVQKESDRFLRGEINYETFQKNLDDINQRHNSQRNKQDIAVLESELEAINSRLATIDVKLPTAKIATKQGEKPAPEIPTPDRTKEIEDLVKQQKEVSEKLAALRKGDAEADAKDRNQLLQDRLKTVQSYTDAIGTLSQSVISFWQTANEAEQRALDRSIAIQQTRVNQAQKIAERGNAQYLASETDRLKQLQVARENAARRQLGIDAALQASQILVGITGAIAKISTGIGVAETIAEIAVIVGALATGYGLVRSLQGNQPRLKEGTPYLQREGHPRGTDTIPALLTEGEAVIPRERNEAYHPTVKAIYDQKIPAKVINEFVKNYTKKTVVNNVVNETSDKKIEDRIVNEVVNNKAKTINEKITDIVSKFSKQDKSEISKLLSSIKTEQTSKIVLTLVKNKIISKEDKKSVSDQLNNTVASHKDYQFAAVVNSIVNKTIDEQSKTKFIQEFGVKKYSQVVNSIATHSEAVNKIINQRLNNIVSDSIISNVSGSDIKRYSEVIDRTINERGYIPKTRPIEAPMSPAYERIKEAADMKITHDATLALSLTEQNKLIEENNELQRMTLKAMKNLSVSAKMDREGIAIAVHEHVEQMIKNKRV